MILLVDVVHLDYERMRQLHHDELFQLNSLFKALVIDIVLVYALDCVEVVLGGQISQEYTAKGSFGEELEKHEVFQADTLIARVLGS